SSRASCRSSSCSSTVRSPVTPGSGRRSATSGCADRRPIRAVGSWARTAGSPPSRSCARAAGGRPDVAVTNGSNGAITGGLYDAIVIGGGHNGLVTAAYLGKAGLRTIVLERRGSLGGAAGTTELAPGVRVPTLAHTVGRLRPSVVRELE